MEEISCCDCCRPCPCSPPRSCTPATNCATCTAGADRRGPGFHPVRPPTETIPERTPHASDRSGPADPVAGLRVARGPAGVAARPGVGGLRRLRVGRPGLRWLGRGDEPGQRPRSRRRPWLDRSGEPHPRPWAPGARLRRHELRRPASGGRRDRHRSVLRLVRGRWGLLRPDEQRRRRQVLLPGPVCICEDAARRAPGRREPGGGGGHRLADQGAEECRPAGRPREHRGGVPHVDAAGVGGRLPGGHLRPPGALLRGR